MTLRILISVAAAWLLGPGALYAQQSVEKILPMDAHIGAGGNLLELNWFDADPPRVGSVTVRRRAYGQTGGQSWEVLGTGLGPVMRYADDTVVPGRAYEYQVMRTAKDIVDVGYWLGGTEVPAEAARGNAWVLVDETVAEPLNAHLARFTRDLAGDGWAVRRRTVSRHSDKDVLENLKTAAAIKAWLAEQYNADPFGRHTVILVGHVPFVRSGRARPDGHDLKSHATDLFYADTDGQWQAIPEGVLTQNRVPGDFIEMQIGRIDFAVVSGGDQETEIRLLRAYFDKNHHWRTGLLGDLRDAYGQNQHLTVEQAALRNIVGASAVTPGGHHDAGEEKSWLWGVDFGDWDGRAYAEKYSNKAVFAINFGSAKQQIERGANAMTALLAQPWYPLAVGWGARPAWWLHHMALGGSVGEVHLRTVNNGRAAENYRSSMDYFPTGKYLWRNPVWVNLLGDPTLRAFPLAPVSGVTTRKAENGTELSWTASPDADTIGYGVWRAPADSSDFMLISGDTPLTETRFTDPAPREGARYMIRAYGLKQVYAGSFYTWSQGAFASETPLTETVMTVESAAGAPVALPVVFTAPQDGRIYAFIEGPATGTLKRQEAGWVYTPPTGFTGTVPLRFSVSDAGQTAEGRLTVTVTE